MTKKIKFHWTKAKWYADIDVFGKKQTIEMMAADEWLETISKNKIHINVLFSTDPLREQINMFMQDSGEAVYIARTFKGRQKNQLLSLNGLTNLLFNDNPTTIFYERTNH